MPFPEYPIVLFAEEWKRFPNSFDSLMGWLLLNRDAFKFETFTNPKTETLLSCPKTESNGLILSEVQPEASKLTLNTNKAFEIAPNGRILTKENEHLSVRGEKSSNTFTTDKSIPEGAWAFGPEERFTDSFSAQSNSRRQILD